MTSVNKLSGIHYGYQPDNENTYTLHTRAVSSQLQVVIDDLMTLQNGRILNLGCGDGMLERLLPKNRSFHSVSVDRDIYAITTLQEILKAQKRDMHDTAIVDNIIQLDSLAYDTGQFDKVISWRVLHGIDPKYYQSFFQKVREKMMKDGIFHLSVASETDWKARKLATTRSFDVNGMNNCRKIMFDDYNVDRKDDFYVYFFTLNKIKELAEKTKFQIIAHSSFQESSGYEHLRHHQNSYLYVQLKAL